MSDQNGATQEGGKSRFDISACLQMMREMTSQGGCSCDCGEMMSQVDFEGEFPEEWLGMMSQMMESCFGRQGTGEDVSEEVVEEA